MQRLDSPPCRHLSAALTLHPSLTSHLSEYEETRTGVCLDETGMSRGNMYGLPYGSSVTRFPDDSTRLYPRLLHSVLYSYEATRVAPVLFAERYSSCDQVDPTDYPFSVLVNSERAE